MSMNLCNEHCNLLCNACKLYLFYKKKKKRYVFLLIFFHCLRSRIVYDNGAAISLKSRGYCFEMLKDSLIITFQIHFLRITCFKRKENKRKHIYMYKEHAIQVLLYIE